MPMIPALSLEEDGGGPVSPDVAKELVMAEVARLVEQGYAAIAALESGTLELRLASGEVFHLGEETFTHVA